MDGTPRERADYTKAENAAYSLLDDSGVESAPVPVASIALKLGLTLEKAIFPDDDVAGLLDLSRNAIIVNRNHHVNRQVFTIAHEIGHHVLHSEKLKKNPDIGIVYRRPIGGETDPIEQEANCFAGNLLVPETLLQRYFSYETSPAEMARMFGVSLEVLQYRLKWTGGRKGCLIPKGTKQRKNCLMLYGIRKS